MRLQLILISAILIGGLGAQAAKAPSARAAKARPAAPAEELSMREEALRQLSAIPTQPRSSSETPSVMMPLKAAYNPLPRRAWDWVFEAEILRRSLEVPRPAGAIGPENLSQLPAFNTFGLGAGLEKSLPWGSQTWRAGLIAQGAMAVSNQDVTLANGLPLSVRYQWISYGVEPRLTWAFATRWSALFGLSFHQVSMIQNSSESELAQWTQGYNERARRFALQFALDPNQSLGLAARQITNEFESPTVLSLTWGARW